MAKQRFGINDAYRGTVGTVIGYEWRGKWCLRSRPRFVRNPRTEKQQHNRQLFKQVVDLTSRLKSVLRVGMRAQSLGMHITEANLFTKSNKGLFWLDDEGRLQADWEQVAVSDGPVVPVADAAVVGSAGTLPATASSSMSAGSRCSVSVTFRPCAEEERASGDDEVYLAAFCVERGEAAMSSSVWRRSRSVSLTLPECWEGNTVELWLFALDYQGRASRAVYVGELVAGEEPEGQDADEATTLPEERLEEHDADETPAVQDDGGTETVQLPENMAIYDPWRRRFLVV